MFNLQYDSSHTSEALKNLIGFEFFVLFQGLGSWVGC